MYTFVRRLARLLLFAIAGSLPGEAAAQGGDCASGVTSPAVITFDNQSSNNVTLYWVNSECKEERFEDIPPRASFVRRTFAKHSWRVRDTESQWLLREIVATATPMTVRISDLVAPIARVLEDRPDDVPGYQVQALYVLPSDGEDRRLDTNGAIALSVAAMQKWFSQQTRGKRLRLDTYEGALDITFVRLSRTGSELRGHEDWIREEIEKELKARGFNHSHKLYSVYYDGDATVCGNGPRPPKLPGNVTAQYLRGTPDRGGRCDGTSLAKSVAEPDLWEFSVAHEILHALGFVASCARNPTKPAICPNGSRVTEGHVSDNPKDLMYAGCEDWIPSILDFKNNDYFDHKIPGCLDLKNSAFLDPLPENAEHPPDWKK